MDTRSPNLPANEDRGPQMMGIFWTMLLFESAIIGLRFHVRYRIHSVGWDDWMMLAAVVRT